MITIILIICNFQSDESQKGDQSDGSVPNQANIEEADGPVLTEEMEKTIAETALIDMVEEDLDEAVRNLANLANSTFDEFEDDSMNPDINSDFNVTAGQSTEKAPSPQTSDAVLEQTVNKPEAEIEMLGCTSDNVAPYVVKFEPVDEEVTMDAEDPVTSKSDVSQCSEAVQEETLMPNLPADFSLKSFDWEENTNGPASVPEQQAPMSFGIKIRSDLLSASSPVPKIESTSTGSSEEPKDSVPLTKSKDPTLLEEPKQTSQEPKQTLEEQKPTSEELKQFSEQQKQTFEEPIEKASSVCTESTDDFTSTVANDNSDASDGSDLSLVVKKKRGRKKKADKMREQSEAAAKESKYSKHSNLFSKPKAVRSGVRLMENDTPVQWLVDMVRTTLRRRHLYSARDMDACLDQLTILPCHVKIERLRESEIIQACKPKKKHLESDPPQNYTSSKVKVNRNEVVDMELARKEFAKNEERNAKKLAFKEQAKKRKLLEKEKDKEKQKKMRLISSDDDSDVDEKPKKVEVEKEKKKVTAEPVADEPPSEGERSRESSVSRPEEKPKELPRSRDISEERKKEDARTEERKKDEARSEEKIRRREEQRRELKEKERREREKSKKHSKTEKEKVEKKPVELPKPLQTPSFKIPKKAENSKPTKDVREFAILPDAVVDQRKHEKKVIVQKVARVERKVSVL
jgi:hypothetical protein